MLPLALRPVALGQTYGKSQVPMLQLLHMYVRSYILLFYYSHIVVSHNNYT